MVPGERQGSCQPPWPEPQAPGREGVTVTEGPRVARRHRRTRSTHTDVARAPLPDYAHAPRSRAHAPRSRAHAHRRPHTHAHVFGTRVFHRMLGRAQSRPEAQSLLPYSSACPRRARGPFACGRTTPSGPPPTRPARIEAVLLLRTENTRLSSRVPARSHSAVAWTSTRHRRRRLTGTSEEQHVDLFQKVRTERVGLREEAEQGDGREAVQEGCGAHGAGVSTGGRAGAPHAPAPQEAQGTPVPPGGQPVAGPGACPVEGAPERPGRATARPRGGGESKLGLRERGRDQGPGR